MKSIAVLLFLPLPAFCQYSEIVTTDDGQQVYFTTLMSERTTPATARWELRIFRIDGTNLELFAERGNLSYLSSGTGEGAFSVQVTGDGQSVAFILGLICPTAGICPSPIRRAEIRGRGATVLGEAQRVLLSRNGKWVIVVPPSFSFGPDGQGPPQPNNNSTLINLETGEKTSIGLPAISNGAFVLASDGSILQIVQSPTSAQVGIWKDGVMMPLPVVGGAAALLGMSDDGGTLLVSRINVSPGQPFPAVPARDLMAVNLRTGASKVLQTLDRLARYVLLGISNDGHWALFQIFDQDGLGPAFLVNVETGESTTLSIGEDELPVSGTLSGSGNTAIIGTSKGRLLRLSLNASGEVSTTEELLPATPYFNPAPLLAPGALIDADRPLSGDIDWNGRIMLNGLPLAVVGQTARKLTLQVPWELRVGLHPVSIDYPSESPFVQRSGLIVSERAPRFVNPPPGTTGILGGLLIKEDYSGSVTEPPKPGEIVHLFMTGLGAVRGPMKTGEPAPTDDPRPIDGVVRCVFPPNTTDAETLFAGLEPGRIGIYRLTFRFPADTPNVSPTAMRCVLNNGGFSVQAAPTP